MKEILLGKTSVGTEMVGSELVHAGEIQAASREIKPVKSFSDPDIYGESPLKTISEKQDTIGDFAPYSGQLQQCGSG